WLSNPTVSPFWAMPYSGYPFAAKVGQFKPPNWTNSEYRNHRHHRPRVTDLRKLNQGTDHGSAPYRGATVSASC
ncbi:MAG: hypothetical protein ABSF90_32375, partial [Syntrophobacteraceae bacterium]